MKIEMDEILSILPHRYPFLLVDKVIKVDIENEEGEFHKNVSFNEPFFQGHFPQNPIMPGVLIIEAMAQSCILTAVKTLELNPKYNEDPKNHLFVLAKINDVKFKKSIIPGDVLVMKIKILNIKIVNGKIISKFQCSGFVDNSLCAECEIIASSQ